MKLGHYFQKGYRTNVLDNTKGNMYEKYDSDNSELKVIQKNWTLQRF